MRLFGRGSMVLITGGAGYIGSRVTAHLIADGLRVRVLDDLSTGKRERLQAAGTEGADYELVVGDVRSESAVREACHGVQAVVHLAAPPPAKSPHEERVAHDVTVTGTWNLLSAAAAEKLHRFVLASSAAVYGPRAPFLLHEEVSTRPSTVEGTHKLAAELYVRLFHARELLPAVILRLFSVYGPGQDGAADEAPLVARFLHHIGAGDPVTLHGDGGQTRDLIHVDDVVRAVSCALKTPGAAGRTFNIASGEAQPVRAIAAILGELAGGLPPPRYKPMRPGEPRDVRASIAAASAGLGWRPQVRLREGLRGCLTGLRRAPTATRESIRKPLPPPPAVKARGTPPPFPTVPPPAEPTSQLFQNRPPSWSVPDDGSSIPVVVQEEPLWT